VHDTDVAQQPLEIERSAVPGDVAEEAPNADKLANLVSLTQGATRSPARFSPSVSGMRNK
jgi:hypothetical protein